MRDRSKVDKSGVFRPVPSTPKLRRYDEKFRGIK